MHFLKGWSVRVALAKFPIVTGFARNAIPRRIIWCRSNTFLLAVTIDINFTQRDYLCCDLIQSKKYYDALKPRFFLTVPPTKMIGF